MRYCRVGKWGLKLPEIFLEGRRRTCNFILNSRFTLYTG